LKNDSGENIAWLQQKKEINETSRKSVVETRLKKIFMKHENSSRYSKYKS
jgi:hypothetical protein